MSPDFNNTFITFILCYSEINEDTSGGRSLNLNFTDEILRRTFRTLVLVNFNFGSQSWGDHTDSGGVGMASISMLVYSVLECL